MRDAGDEKADRSQTLLPNHLTLQRLEHLARLPFLLHLVIEGVACGPQVGGHRDEGVLQVSDFPVRSVCPVRWGKIATRDALGRRTQPVQPIAGVMRQQEREPEDNQHGRTADSEMPRPERRQPVADEGTRDADTQRPRSPIDGGGADEPLDTIDVDLQRGVFANTRLRRGRDRLTDVSFAVGTAGENLALLIEQRERGAIRKSQAVEYLLQLQHVEAQGEHADNRAVVCAHRVRLTDGRAAGQRP